MEYKIGIISDIHATPAPLEEALNLFEQHKVDEIMCPGDICGYGDAIDETITLLKKNHCRCVAGNHEAWFLEKSRDKNSMAYEYIKSLPHIFKCDITGKKLFMVHANPPDAYLGGIRLLNKQGKLDAVQKQKWTNELVNFEHDLLIVGHTHQVFAEQLGNTLVINPGSSAYNHSCAILSLPEMSVEFFPLSEQEIKICWNWSEQFKN